MANVDLSEIPTKDILTSRDHLNMEVIHGKFNLSYRVGLSGFSGFFLRSDDIRKMTEWIDNQTRKLEQFVYGPGNRLMTKDEMDATFMPISESKFYRRKLLTGEVMENLCLDYATRKQLSATLNMSGQKGMYSATELANILAWIAAVCKTQQYINEANAQIGAMQASASLVGGDAIGEGAAALVTALAEAKAALEEALAALAAAEEAGGGEGGGGGGGGGGSDWNLKDVTLIKIWDHDHNGSIYYVMGHIPARGNNDVVLAGPYKGKDPATNRNNATSAANSKQSEISRLGGSAKIKYT